MSFFKDLIKRLLPEDPVPTEERRQSVRLTFQVPIEVTRAKHRFRARLVNLTFTGLCLQINQKLEEDDEIILSRDDFGPPLGATVMWCKPRDGDTYIVGVECDLDEEELINSWLEPTLVQAGFEAEYVGEKRKLIRVPGRIDCQLTGEEGKDIGQAKMLDLSSGGALVEASFQLEQGQAVGFETAALGKLKPLRGRAVVMSARQEGETWQHGLKFDSVDAGEIEPYIKFMLDSGS